MADGSNGGGGAAAPTAGRLRCAPIAYPPLVLTRQYTSDDDLVTILAELKPLFPTTPIPISEVPPEGDGPTTLVLTLAADNPPPERRRELRGVLSVLIGMGWSISPEIQAIWKRGVTVADTVSVLKTFKIHYGEWDPAAENVRQEGVPHGESVNRQNSAHSAGSFTREQEGFERRLRAARAEYRKAVRPQTILEWLLGDSEERREQRRCAEAEALVAAGRPFAGSTLFPPSDSVRHNDMLAAVSGLANSRITTLKSLYGEELKPWYAEGAIRRDIEEYLSDNQARLQVPAGNVENYVRMLLKHAMSLPAVKAALGKQEGGARRRRTRRRRTRRHR